MFLSLELKFDTKYIFNVLFTWKRNSYGVQMILLDRI